jgi:hypothetical protein
MSPSPQGQRMRCPLRQNLSPGLPIHRDRLSPQGRGTVPKGRILLFRKAANVGATHALPSSPKPLPRPLPTGEGSSAKGNFLLFRKATSAAEAVLPSLLMERACPDVSGGLGGEVLPQCSGNACVARTGWARWSARRQCGKPTFFLIFALILKNKQ